MSEHETVEISLAGLQTKFKLPARPEPPPRAIQRMTSKVEGRRARSVWDAACRFRMVIQLWCHFLMMGMLGRRLDDASEDAVTTWFPELGSMGGVLNVLAQRVEQSEEGVQHFPALDQKLQLKRGPSQRHANDVPKDFGARTVQQLVTSFRDLMQLHGERLHALEIRKELFERPLSDLRADIAKLTCLDMDFCGDRPALDCAKALKNAEFPAIRGRFIRELKELRHQLEADPEVVLRRPEQGTSRKAREPRPDRGLSRDKANEKVCDYLMRHHKATSREIAETIGCSEGQVRSTPAWKAVSEERRQRRPKGKKVGLEIAEKQKGEEIEKAQKREEKEGEPESDKIGEDERSELGDLIKQQCQDARNDQRRPRRKKK